MNKHEVTNSQRREWRERKSRQTRMKNATKRLANEQRSNHVKGKLSGEFMINDNFEATKVLEFNDYQEYFT